MTKNADSPFEAIYIERDKVDATMFGSPTATYVVGYTTITIVPNPEVPFSDLMANAFADSLRRSPYTKVEVSDR